MSSIAVEPAVTEPATVTGLTQHTAVVAAALGALAALALGDLPPRELQRLLAALAPLGDALAGVASRVLGELAVRGGGTLPWTPTECAPEEGPGVRYAATAAWLRDTINLSGRRAGAAVRTATAPRELPLVAGAMASGQISVEHGAVLARLVGLSTPAVLAKSEPALVELARLLDPDQLAHYVRHLIATWYEPKLDADERAAEARRYLQVVDNHDGSWRGRFVLSAAPMESVLAVLEPLARRDGDQHSRCAGQRRADALVEVFQTALRHDELPDAGGERAHLSVVVPAEWVSGPVVGGPVVGGPEVGGPAAGEPVLGGPRPALGTGPVDIDTLDAWAARGATGAYTGPLTRAQVATLGCDAYLERLLVDDAGQVVSLVAIGERITRAQRRAVAGRDRRCTARGCTRPPSCCDVHHLRARADGGLTELDNVVLLCRRHHVRWHRGEIGVADLRVPWLRPP